MRVQAEGLCYFFIDKTKASQCVANLYSLSRCARRAEHDRDLHPEVSGVDVEDELNVCRNLISRIHVATLGVSCKEGLEDRDCDRVEFHVILAFTANVILSIILPFEDAFIVVDCEVFAHIHLGQQVEKIIHGGALPELV